MNAAIRIRTYARLMLVWWAARSARLLYDLPRGQDERLVEQAARRLDGARANYERYLNLATTWLA